MSVGSRINRVRRWMMRRVTRKFGASHIDGAVSSGTIRRILVCRTNHRLGNLLLITPLLAELEQVFPGAKVDLFVKGSIAPVLFKNFPQVDRIVCLPKKPMRHFLQYAGRWFAILTHRYDLAINVVFNSSSGRISTQLVNARNKFLGDADAPIRDIPDYEHMAKFPVYGVRSFVKQMGMEVHGGPIASLSIRLTPSEIAEGRKILKDLVLDPKCTVALYTFATGAKCYEMEWWERLYESLKIRVPEVHIIEVLPIENVSQIGFRAPSFYSKDLRQIAALIHNVDVFIGADSGMMHLASASGTSVIGLFKAQNMRTYAPYNKGSAGVDTNAISMEELVNIVVAKTRRIP